MGNHEMKVDYSYNDRLQQLRLLARPLGQSDRAGAATHRQPSVSRHSPHDRRDVRGARPLRPATVGGWSRPWRAAAVVTAVPKHSLASLSASVFCSRCALSRGAAAATAANAVSANTTATAAAVAAEQLRHVHPLAPRVLLLPARPLRLLHHFHLHL